MSSTATSTAAASSQPSNILDGFSQGGTGQKNQGISLGSFVASLAAGLAVFGIELGVFFLLHGKFTRIYQPRTFLVPERERTKAPPKGLWQWLIPVFSTTNTDFIQKCGLDAYFFLRYLRTLLKIFIPLALLIIPILFPLNLADGRGPAFAVGPFENGDTYKNVTGLDTLAWGNVRPANNHRYWGHLVLSVIVVVYTCFVFFDELRSYVRLRQAYLTSPQHRLRASATTVLVTAIPTKWCTFEALDGLYDVFPGGIRNIWVNRNFDDLSEKVKLRKQFAKALESAETNLIKKAKEEHMKKVKAEEKKAKKKKNPGKTADDTDTEAGVGDGQMDGISSGDPHQIHHNIDEEMDEASGDNSSAHSSERKKPLPAIGQGIEAVGQGLGNVGKAVFGGFKKVGKDVDGHLNTTGGFVPPTPEMDGSRTQTAAEEDNRGRNPQRSTSDSPSREQRNPSRNTDYLSVNEKRSRSRSLSPSPQRKAKDVNRIRSRSPPKEQAKESTGLGIDGALVDPRVDGALDGSDVINNPERLGEADEKNESILKFWKRKQKSPFGIPSPVPHGQEEDEFPLSSRSPMTPSCNPQAVVNGKGGDQEKKTSKKSKKDDKDEKEETKYPSALEEDYDPEEGTPKWKEYVKESDRETMRLPLFGKQWMPTLPLLGKKVDTIDYCRKEVARLNLEIEQDQKSPEKYPLMNSAFVQFNHQVAAHMACQAVSHHAANHMAPRIVECSPNDVIWDNMSIKWWESYIRTGAIILLTIVLIVCWAIPVTFTGLLSNVSYLSTISWLKWIAKAPTWILSIIQGVLPQALLALFLVILPFLLRLFARLQGNVTGMSVELSVQIYYFSFLFVQVFLVVSISSGITVIIPQIAQDPISVPALLAQNLPRASNYFFSYMLLQAFSVSAGALVQIGGLFKWFILAPIMDSTARQKWARQLKLPNMRWGTFFPVYTNLACIGLIYSVISPLMMVFNIITFSLFWLVYRYNTLYVTKFRFDTGGLLYPTAIKQLFTGLYFMELVMIGLFFLVRDVTVTDGQARPDGNPCYAHGIIMVVVLIFTVIYHYILHQAFSPLLQYLPITLEDEAVMRDEQFARAQEKRWALEGSGQESEPPADQFTSGRRSPTPHAASDDIEMDDVSTSKEYGLLNPRNIGAQVGKLVPGRVSWAERSRQEPKSPNPPEHDPLVHRTHRRRRRIPKKTHDVEGQQTGPNALAEALFAGIHDEIEDLTPDERDRLIQRAFQHEALRARRPVIWIPRDDIGVSDDEIRRTQKMSKYVWVSNEHTALDKNGKVVFRRSPPDFSELDLIEL